MKILWVKSDFLHPTNRGGQIRTLEMLRHLHRNHEVHYAALDDGKHAEGPARASEYCTKAYSVPHFVPEKTSLAFAGQLVQGLVSRLPVAVNRYRSERLKSLIQSLLAEQKFDSLVCDFLFPAPNIPDLSKCVLFQHNVESVIWKRHVEQANDPLRRSYLQLQAKRMFDFEREVCRRVGHIIAVSKVDLETMRDEFGASRISEVATGVDLEYFAPPADVAKTADLIFLGSMDWMPNIDGMRYFVDEVFPLIRRERPDCRLKIVGRKPAAAIQEMAGRDRNIEVTGTVPDVRPHLWESHVSIVPLRIGGGTRLKIYEAIAAKVPVVSTAIGAEGLPLTNGRHIEIADTPELFAARCLLLLNEQQYRRNLIDAAYSLVAERFSWGAVAAEFEQILSAHSLSAVHAGASH